MTMKRGRSTVEITEILRIAAVGIVVAVRCCWVCECAIAVVGVVAVS